MIHSEFKRKINIYKYNSECQRREKNNRKHNNCECTYRRVYIYIYIYIYTVFYLISVVCLKKKLGTKKIIKKYKIFVLI